MDTMHSSSKPSESLPPDYQGHHGKMDCQNLNGWAWDKNHPQRAVQIDIYLDDRRIATLTADKFRADLLAQRIGTGNYGFRFPLPPRLRDGQAHSIRLRFAGTMIDLQQTPKTMTCHEDGSITD